ncbi:hypothetical protein MXD98_16500, partial [Legionella pneumophila]|nr:hypothetical protein [Legionella pneumophila]
MEDERILLNKYYHNLSRHPVDSAARRFYEKNGFVLVNKNSLPKEFKLCPLDTHFYYCETDKLDKSLRELI